MAKKVLGRGLRELLPERRPPTSNKQQPSNTPVDLGRGLRVLGVQKNGTAPQRAAVREQGGIGTGTTRSFCAPSSAMTPNGGLIEVSLVIADILLVLTTVLWQSHTQGQMSVGEAVVCSVAITVAAWTSVLAAWLHFHRT